LTEILHPHLTALLQQAVENNAPELCTFPIEKARRLYQVNAATLAGKPPTIRKTADKTISGEDGDLPLRIYWPDKCQESGLPVLVYFHGGGWCLGNIDSYDHICRWLTANSGCVVVSVNYRMGPEHKFPAAVEDAILATQWVADNAADIGADAQRIGVGGDSAGANLAAVVALTMRDKQSVSIKAQLLIYPATDMRMSAESHQTHGEGYRLTRSMMIWSVVNYLRDGSDVFDFRASPLLASDHANLPPAMVLTAGFDPLRDEGEAYANKLRDSGVPVEYVCYADMIHGFIGMTDVVDTATEALLEASGFLQKVLGR